MASSITRYELARILGARSLQIALGAPVLIKSDKKDPIRLASEELEKGRIPFIVVRTSPDGSSERVEVLKWAK